MINPILEIRNQSRLFNEPLPTKPTTADLAKEVDEAIEALREMQQNCRRLENRLVLVRERIAATEVGK